MLTLCIFPNQHYILSRHVDSLSTLALYVRFIIRVHFIVELAISKVEINILVILPRLHQSVIMYVSATKTNECPW
jgi:hypothetical protein